MEVFMKSRVWFTLALSAALTGVLIAQTKSDGQFEAGVFVQSDSFTIPIPPPPEEGMFVSQDAAPGKLGDVTFAFVSSELSAGDKIVKGAPYSGEAVTETVQVLSDGNRITRKNTAQVYRDSEGRSRRDQSLGGVGPWGPANESFQRIFIYDPVGGFHYVLNPQEHSARKMPVPQRDADGQNTVRKGPGGPPRPGRLMRGFGGGVGPFDSESAEKESLGKQVMEGVQVEGTSSTVTIEAGKIGNELPIQMVSERWYSPELQVVVMSRHVDPRIGETTYRLSNINQSEPAHSLFEVPADYKLDESVVHHFQRRKHAAEKPSN
jgi:hypothetical protein